MSTIFQSLMRKYIITPSATEEKIPAIYQSPKRDPALTDQSYTVDNVLEK